ncbi:hypothetical protein QBC34DRAFT_430179 [Podospora aff. communis PSN243]|uniref:Uncharacterized protein n=1 Tax=Podospora aff. communis PSN243 TaxID=3040156 RepID=A0AAV9G7N4_9PEZI|nr:hypothetical protein QBC34DRAFT_430179 [Podospora aff. communis PSN243]
MAYPNPLRLDYIGAPTSAGVTAAPAPSNPFGPENPDVVLGIITTPRPSPHRSGKPRKSCLKKAESTFEVKKKPALRNTARFTSDWSTVVGRCAITGRMVFPNRRDREEWTKWHRHQVKALRAMGLLDRPSKAIPDWTSDCDVPMSGVSHELDFAAARSQAEEEDLDRRIREAYFIGQLNESKSSPIKRKQDRCLHPAVIESKRQRAWNPGPSQPARQN